MKKWMTLFVLGVGLAFVLGFHVQNTYALDAGIFISDVERAANQVIDAWIEDHPKDLKKALGRLAVSETYLLAIGKSGNNVSYLRLVPKGLNNNLNKVAAYLFLIQQKREGVDLVPISFFEGRRFRFEEMEVAR